MLRRTAVGGLALCVLALAAPARAADAELIGRAVDKGVAFLKQQQRADGTWGRPEVGGTALAGLALLECGVEPDDPAMEKTATVLRQASVNLTHTYSLALTILFFDRLGDPADVPLIESMAVRLLAGQSNQGGWTYECPPSGDAEARRLQDTIRRRNELVAGRELPKPGVRREVKDLPREIQQQLQLVGNAQAAPGVGGPAFGAGDNSNTQFALLALWAARRQGIPVDKALARVDARFRATQNPDGGWHYTGSPNAMMPANMPMIGMGSTPAMTCAGLLGLAAEHGIVAEAAARRNDPNAKAPPDPAKDKAVKAGLLALGTALGDQAPQPPGIPPQQPGMLPPGPGRGPMPIVLNPRANSRGYYFLWSLERVAVTYGLDTIGNKDWYTWGSTILLANQGPDGSWSGEYAEGGVDTAFALLFLKRANLAKDLTAVLKGKVQDPDTRELKAGGVGGTDFLNKIGLKPAFEAGDKPNDKPAAKVPVESNGETTRLASDLVGAQGAKQEQVLDKLRDTKGAVYTDALALAIPKLNGPIKAKAREALADRMARMTAATLKEKMKDDDLEVRRAAALACAMKEEKEHIPRLIELLEDPEPPVARAAYAALKSLTNQDFGPAAEASRAEVKKAAAAWTAWWNKKGGK